jgi:hypothetical protein
MSPPKGKKKASNTARVLGSGSAGIIEQFVFHPVDTTAKRLMSHQSKVVSGGLASTLANVNKVVFKDAASKGLVSKYLALFPGISFAVGYKISQRIYKFGGQPIINDYVDRFCGSWITNTFGQKKGKMLMEATSGSLIGIGEVVLLPLDVLKIKSQTNPEALRGRGLFAIIRDEGMNLYKGSVTTALRNAPGSFALFGGASFVKEYIFHLKDYRDATFFQDFCASIGGAFASITVASPLDVVKTRIQNKDFSSKVTGTQIITNMIKEEGVGAFFKGLTPKLLTVGPKLVFAFTIASQLITVFDDAMSKKH